MKFGIAGLVQPSDFLRLLADVRHKSKSLLHCISLSPPNAQVIVLMDELSNELCKVYDAAECCRNVHPDLAWQIAASKVCHSLGEFITTINHDVGIYHKMSQCMQRYKEQCSRASFTLKPPSQGALSVITDAGLDSAWSSAPCLTPLSDEEARQFDPETALVGSKLLMDMVKAGVHLPEGSSARQRMAESANLNQHYGMAFNRALSDPKELPVIDLSPRSNSASSSPWSSLISRATRGERTLLDGTMLNRILTTEPREDIRRATYIAGYSGPLSNLKLLEEMRVVRHEMAQVLGYSSYSRYKAAGSSLAQTPDAIVGFLNQVSERIKPEADKEVEVLRGLKKLNGSSTGAEAWDTEYLMNQQRQEASQGQGGGAIVREEYFGLMSILRGFGDLMSHTFDVGVTVAPAPVEESWVPDLLKLSAHDKRTQEPLGTIYLDLCSRAGKFPGAVTFPIQCPKQLTVDTRQLPIMALLADFGSEGVHQMTLGFRDVQTLLHELGHCFHNLSSNSKYQHLSGTRCAQDMVEVPSHLFEHFATDRAAMRLICRHRSSNEPLPDAAFDHLVRSRELFLALEMQNQLILAIVDQAYFGTPSDLSSTQIWENISRAHSSIRHPSGTNPQCRIGHFTVYGGSYYSYVYARFISSMLWHKCLSVEGSNSVLDNQEGCRRAWKGFLSPGGSIEPLDLMRSVLEGDDALTEWRGKDGTTGWSPKLNSG